MPNFKNIQNWSLIISVLLFIIPAGNIYGQQDVKVYSDSLYLKQLRDSIETILQETNYRFDEKKVTFKPLANIDYSSRIGLRLSAGVKAEYFTGNRVVVHPSSTSLEVGYTTNHSHFGEIRGEHYSKFNRWMLKYNLAYSSYNSYFWGIGYENNNYSENKSEYTRVNARIIGEHKYRATKEFALGPIVGFNYTSGEKFTRPDLVEGLPLYSRGLHIGVHFQYDSRDDTYFPTKGVNAYLAQRFYPNLLFDIKPYYKTDFIFDAFINLWRGAILAIDITGDFNFCDTPWTLYPLLGGHTRMRGYYRGKYTDKNMVTAQAELRQTIFKGSRIVIWGGAGNVFPSFSNFRLDHTLPTYGIGYRLQLHKTLTFRIDYGFGIKGQRAFSIGLGEAF